MNNIKTVLYATDYSENAVTALKFAHAICEKSKAKLIVFHTCDIPTFLESTSLDIFEGLEKEIENDNRKKLEEYCKKNLSSINNIQFEAKGNSSVILGIIDMIEESDANLLVLGTKDVSNLEELILGSTVKEAISKVTCPVLTVPTNVNKYSFDKILYATDFEDKDISAIKILAQVASLFDAEIIVSHVFDDKEYLEDQDVSVGHEKLLWFKELVMDQTSYNKIDFKLLLSNDIHKSLNKFIENNNISLISMLERKPKGIFDRFFHQDLVQKMEWHSSIPLLSFNEEHLPNTSKNGNES